VIALLSLLGPATDAVVMRGLTAAGLSGLRGGHGYVVQRLIDGPSTVSEMRASLGVTQQAISKTVGELVELGYIRRAVDSSDHRRRPLELTARGREAVEVARRVRHELEVAVEQVVGRGTVEAGRAMLLALVDVLGMAVLVAVRSVPPPEDTL
jgi:DNA-binding MarR family transcriptional regulator